MYRLLIVSFFLLQLPRAQAQERQAIDPLIWQIDSLTHISDSSFFLRKKISGSTAGRGPYRGEAYINNNSPLLLLRIDGERPLWLYCYKGQLIKRREEGLECYWIGQAFYTRDGTCLDPTPDLNESRTIASTLLNVLP